MKNKVQLALDKLWAGIITYFHHDLLNHRLTFSVMVTEVEATTYKVSIDEISSIIFDNPSAYNYNDYDYEWDILEVSSFDYSPNCDFRYSPSPPLSPKEGTVEQAGKFNLVLEIFSTEVLILAKRLQINEKTFQLL